MSALSVSVWSSIGQGMLAANGCGLFADLELLECTPAGGELLLLVQGPASSVSQFHDNLIAQNPLRQKYFSTFSPRVMQAYLSLENASMKEHLFVVETDFVGDLFDGVEQLFAQGAECIDLRLARGAARNSYALMTSAQPIQKGAFSVGASTKITVVNSLAPPLKSFFDLSP